MANGHRSSAAEQKRWLGDFATSTLSRLRAAGVSRSTRLVAKPRLYRAEYEGWYVRLGSFRDRPGGPYLFLDRMLERGYRTLWYGVWSPTADEHRATLKRAKKLWPRVESWDDDETPAKQRVAHPFSENPGSGEFYFGRYEWARPRFDSSPTAAWLSRAADFLVALDKLWSEQSRQRESNRVPGTVALRRGQARFRTDLLVAYSGKCCVTESQTEPVLEAAHIEVTPGSDIHEVSNGLLLRSDIHTLFDLALLAVHPDKLSVELHPDLRETDYGKYEGKPVPLPTGVDERSFRRRLKQRWMEFQRSKRRSTW